MNELHIIFGGGVLGKNAARALHERGHRVRVVNRSGKADSLPAGVEVLRADAMDAAQAHAAAEGAHAIYQCAQPEYHEWAHKFPPLQRNILQAAASQGARLIVADNLYMYGDTRGAPITEDLPYAATTRKGRVRAAMAREVIDAHERGHVRVAIVRASNFFGPEDRAVSPRIFQAALDGKTVDLIGRTDMPHTYSYAPDFGRALALLGMDDRALGEVWHVPSNAPVTQRELIARLERVLGKPVKTRVSGVFALTLLGLFNATVRELPELMYEWTKPFVMSDAKFRRVFAFEPTPLDEALAQTVRWFRKSK
jgi:nucleoside-diphosphate-sugar epimerase